MRIQSCYIENFGKLHRFSFSFDPHLTVLVEENGWGKSTLAAFIKAMFYGMDYKPRAKLSDNERKKYLPWQVGSYGGSLIFEQNGKTYRVERSFGRKASEDTFALYEEQTGMPSEDFSTNLGEELFGVDQVSYGYTTYLAQNKHELEGTDQIFSLLTGDTAQSGEAEKDSYSEAVKRLKEEARQYKKTGGRGSIDLTINRITQAEQELKNAYARVDSYGEWSRRLDQCLEQITVQKKKLAEDTKLVEKVGLSESSRARKEQLLSLQRREKGLLLQLEELEGHFPGLTPENIEEFVQDLSQQRERAAQLSKERQELSSKQTQFDTLSMMPVVVPDLPKEEDWEPEKSRSAMLYLILAGVTAVVALALGILVTPWALLGLLLCVGFGLLSVTERRKAAQADRKRREQEKERRQQQIQRQKEAAQADRNGKLSSYREELEALQENCQKTEQELIRALAAYRMQEVSNYETAFVMLQEMLKNAEKLNRELTEIRQEIAELMQTGEEIQPDEESEIEFTMEQVRSRQKQDEDALYGLLEEEKAYRSQLLRLEGAEQQAGELEEELEVLRTKLTEDEMAFDRIETTINLLEEARERFSNRYADPVKKSFERYAASLGFSGEEQPGMDARLSVAVTASGMQRETDYFSKGTRDLLWLCARLAVVESVFTKEKPVLILDDPFSELDEEHNRKAQSVIRQLSEEHQILYMTCHESRATALK